MDGPDCVRANCRTRILENEVEHQVEQRLGQVHANLTAGTADRIDDLHLNISTRAATQVTFFRKVLHKQDNATEEAGYPVSETLRGLANKGILIPFGELGVIRALWV